MVSSTQLVLKEPASWSEVTVMFLCFVFRIAIEKKKKKSQLRKVFKKNME